MAGPVACFGHARKRLCLALAHGRPASRSSAIRYATTSSLQKPTASESSELPPSSSALSSASTRAVAPNRQTGNEMTRYKPITPGRRHLIRVTNSHLWKGKPLRALTYVKKGHGKGGRNNTGRIAMRHLGGGHRRRIRTVDYLRMEPGKHTVMRIEYDPNRSAHLALLRHDASGSQSYIVAAEGMRAGDTTESFRRGIPAALRKEMGSNIDPGMLAVRTASRGNCLPIHMVPVGTQVYNIGSRSTGPAVFCRSAGTSAFVMAHNVIGSKIRTVSVKLQSGEVRTVDSMACATIGVASNPMYKFEQWGKAGKSRWKNVRPTVRGVAMNACDHPHGGGRGKSKGNVHPVSIWGTPAKSGFKTRAKRNPNKYVVEPRVRNQGKRKEKGTA